MPPTKLSLAAALDVITEKAPGLRGVGVLSVELEGVKFTVAPLEVAASEDEKDKRGQRTPPSDPFDDPATFGGRIPGYGDPQGFDER